MKRKKSSQQGVALLMSLGMLALLSILGAAFAVNMRLMERTARDFVYEVQARYLAEAGIEYAIAELKQDARTNFIYGGINPGGADRNKIILPSGQITLPSGSTVEITAIATALQINLDSNIANLANTLENLDAPDHNMTADEANAIVALKNNLTSRNLNFISKEQIKMATFQLGGSAINEEEYNAIKDFIAVNGYEDENCDNRSAVNINIADRALIQAVIAPLNGVTEPEAVAVAEHLISETPNCDTCGGTGLINNSNCPICAGKGRLGRPYRTWDDFNRMIDRALADGHINSNNDADVIKNNVNPNRTKPGTFTTEFCFHSGGTYELTVTGTITKAGQVVANKTITTIAEIFNLENFTKRTDFIGDDTNYNGIQDAGEGPNIPEYARVTWLDSCPVNIDECYQDSYADDAPVNETIADSLKVGYWDNFRDDSVYSTAQWEADEDESPDGYQIVNEILSTTIDPNKDPLTQDAWPTIDLGTALASGDAGDSITRRWQWKSISLKAHVIDEDGNSKGRVDIPRHSVPRLWGNEDPRRLQKWQDVGQILFLKVPGPENHCSFYTTRADICNGPQPVDTDMDGQVDEYWYGDNGSDKKISKAIHDGDPPNLFSTWHDGEGDETGLIHECTYADHITPRLILNGVWNYPESSPPRDLPNEDDREESTYNREKNFHFYLHTDSDSGQGEYPIFSGKISPADEVITNNMANLYNGGGPGIISFYGQANLPDLYTIRIISRDGYYISPPIDFGVANHEWGTIFWTMTIPSTVDFSGNPPNEEVKTSFEVKSSTGTDFGAYGTWSQGRTGDKTTPGVSIGITENNHQYLKFKVFLECRDERPDNPLVDPYYLNCLSETPVLEDVWITYLPKTRILYWREN